MIQSNPSTQAIYASTVRKQQFYSIEFKNGFSEVSVTASYKDQWFTGTRNCIKVGELLTKSVVASFRRVFPTTRDVLLICIHHSILHLSCSHH